MQDQMYQGSVHRSTHWRWAQARRVKARSDSSNARHGVQRLLGMVNYVAKFALSVSEVTAPLRELLKKDVAWHWTERHEQSFHDIKCLLTDTSLGLLKYYASEAASGCMQVWIGCSIDARWVTNCIRFPFTYRDGVKLRQESVSGN